MLTRWLRRSRPVLVPQDEAYRQWAPIYPPYPHNPLMQVEQAMLAPMIVQCEPRVALDVGTGTGRYMSVLQRAGAHMVVGIDLSAPMLRRQTRDAIRIQADARALPFRSARFDVVCASLMAGDLDDLGSWLRESSRVLTPGGHLLYSDFHPEWGRRGWRRTFTAADGRDLEVAYVSHGIDLHLRLADAAGFRVRAIREPRLPDSSVPMLVVLHLEKPRPGDGVPLAEGSWTVDR